MIATETEANYHADIMRMLTDGMRPFQIANQLGLTYEFVHTICFASEIRYAGRHLTQAMKDEIRRLREIEGLPIRKIAQRLGVSKTVVGVWSRRRYLAVQRQGGTTVVPVPLKTPKRCPVHGLVRLWPCVACAATASKQSRNR